MRPRPCKWWCCPFGKAPLRIISVGLKPRAADDGAPDIGVDLRLVDYVPAADPHDPQKTVRRWPDVLRDLPADGFEVPPGETRVLWLTFRVPRDTEPGAYEFEVTATAEGGEQASIPVHLTVHPLTLPDPSDWTFRVDFWQAFGRLAKAYDVPEWSDEWWRIVEVFLRDLAAHGESVVQVGRAHFDWRRGDGGRWSFGFERFDRYVELCERVGIDGLIEYLQMFDGRAPTTISYTDANGRMQRVTANPGDPEFDGVWLAFAKALAAHCREKGWLDRLVICPTDEPQDVYGEPTLERFRTARRLLRQADPALRTTCALDSLRSARMLRGDIDRFVFKLREDVYDPAFAAELREQGKQVEAYICCHPDRPNSFITSEAIEQRVIGWICWQERFEGLLRWSYVNWPPEVWQKPEGDGKYAPGDLFIVYPGDRNPLASTRWERLREGFEDVAMLRAVQGMIDRAPAEKQAAAQAAVDAAVREIAGPRGKLTEYTRDAEAFAAARRKVLEVVGAL